MQIAKRLIPAALLAIGSLVLLCSALSILLELFGGWEPIFQLATKWMFCIFAFYAAGLATVADHLTDGKCNRLTAIAIAAVAIHVGFACWFSVDTPRGPFDEAFAFQFVWMLASAALGAFSWLRIRRVCSTSFASTTESPLSQFSIGSMMIWFALIGIFLTLLTRSAAFPVPWNMKIVTNPKKEVVAGVILAVAFLPWTTRWLLRSNRFASTAAGVWLIVFAGSWILFFLIGLSQPGYYDSADRYVTKIIAFAFAALLYLLWLGITKRFLFGNALSSKAASTESRSLRPGRLAFNSVSLLLGIYFGLWLFLNFSSESGTRSSDWMDQSPEILAVYNEAYGTEVYETVEALHQPETVEEWGRHLARNQFSKEQDAIHQIASLTEIPHMGVVRYPHLRKAMGFSPEEIEALPNETIEGWVVDLLLENSEPDLKPQFDAFMLADHFKRFYRERWTEKNEPLYARYCQQKKELFQKIRNAINNAEVALLPQTEDGFQCVLVVAEFATKMLAAETNYALQRNDLELAFENVDAMAQLVKILKRDPFSARLVEYSAHTMTINLLARIADVIDDEHDLKRMEGIVAKLETAQPITPGSRARSFATAMLGYPAMITDDERNQVVLHKKPLVVELIRRFANCIDWSEFTKAAKTKFFGPDGFWDEAAIENMSPKEVSKLASRPSRSPDEQFHEQAIDLIAIPKFRSRRLAEYCMDVNGHYFLIISTVSQRIQLVGIKLTLHRLKHGKYPETLEEIDGPIRDPFTGKQLVYHFDEVGFELWSCGPNQTDDGGLNDRINQFDDLRYHGNKQ